MRRENRCDRKSVDREQRIIFLDAFVPESGQSHMELFSPEHAEIMRGDARHNGAGYMLTAPRAHRVNVNAADAAAWVGVMCVKHPLACLEQKLTLAGARERVPRRIYILATGYQPSPFKKFAACFDRDPTRTVRRIDCGHLVMLDCPEDLADMLTAAA